MVKEKKRKLKEVKELSSSIPYVLHDELFLHTNGWALKYVWEIYIKCIMLPHLFNSLAATHLSSSHGICLQQEGQNGPCF